MCPMFNLPAHAFDVRGCMEKQGGENCLNVQLAIVCMFGCMIAEND